MQSYPNVLPVSRQYMLPINMGRATAAFTGAIWAMRNGTINRIRIRRVIFTVTFDGVGQADTSLLGMYRFSGANYTGGTALIPVKKDTTMVSSTVQDARQASAAALGNAGVILETYAFIATSNQRDKGATTTEEHSFSFNECIVLNSGEGLVINQDVVSVIGDAISGSVEFDEV